MTHAPPGERPHEPGGEVLRLGVGHPAVAVDERLPVAVAFERLDDQVRVERSLAGPSAHCCSSLVDRVVVAHPHQPLAAA
jgi:hypothetical protein